MSNQMRIAQLTWLRSPIQKSIDTTKHHLDIYASKNKALVYPPADAGDVWFQNQRKHRAEAFESIELEVIQIHAALDIADCIGGRALALEIKIIVNNIGDNRLSSEKIEPSLVSVLNGLLTIPKYMGMVINGAPDSAGILAKQINELRELRGVGLLEEDNLLPPEVEFVFVAPPLRQAEIDEDSRNEAYARAPKRFQTAFSSYMNNQNKAALAELGTVLRELQRVTYDIEVGCFWWLGECLVDALACGAVRAAGDTLSKIRMLSVAIQKADSDGEEGAKATLGVARFKSLLSVLSMSTKLPESIEQVLAVFNVRKSVDAASLAELQTRIDSSSVHSVKDVLVELKPLVEAAIVSLGRAISSNTQQAFDQHTSTFRTSMRQMASVFYMVNESELAAVAAQSLARVTGIKSPGDLTTTVIDNLKTDFMFLDEHIRMLDANQTIKSLSIPGVMPDVILNVIEQTIIELTRTRRLITDHLDSGAGAEELKTGLERLLGAASVLAFSGLTRVGQLLQGSYKGFLSEITANGMKVSDRVSLSARILVVVESYLSALQAGIDPSPELMKKAEEAIAELGIDCTAEDSESISVLMQKFETARFALPAGEEDNHLLTEMYELRKVFEQCLQHPDAADRMTMDNLYKAAARLGVAAKLYGFDQLHRLSHALGDFCLSIHSRLQDPDGDLPKVQHLLVSSLDMILRCIDEYSARGKVSIFTRDQENALTRFVEPIKQEDLTHMSVEDSDVKAGAVVVLHGELVEHFDSLLRPYPDDVDAGHIEMYREEYTTYHKLLFDFCCADRHPISRDMCRASHTLHGISGSVGCEVLQEFFGVLEIRLEALMEAGVTIPPDDIDVLKDLLNQTHAFMLEFPWATTTNRLDQWIINARALGDVIEDGVFTEIPISPAPFLAVDSVQSGSMGVPQPHLVAEEKIPHAESFRAGEVGSDEAHLIVRTAQPVDSGEGQTASEYNENYQFYLDEAEDVFPTLTANVTAWLANMDDRELVLTIKRNMHTLKGAALMAEAESIASITHAMESLFESLSIKLINAGNDCAELVTYAMDTMTSMTQQMRQGRPYSIPTPLINCLNLCVSSNSIDLTILHTTREVEQSPECDPSAKGQVAEAIENNHNLAQPDVQVQVQVVDAAHSEVAVPSAENLPGANLSQIGKQRKRGGRGKGGRGRQAGDHDSESTPTMDNPPVNEPGDDVEVIAALDDSLSMTAKSEPDELDGNAPTIPVASADADTSPASLADREEKFSHAESFEMSPVQNTAEQEASDAFDKLHAIPTDELGLIDEPITSQAVLQMLARESEMLGPAEKTAKSGTSEKIRVDLKHLESAAEKASELVAVRYRLSSLNEEAHLKLTGARELLDVNTLQHGQLTTALRSYANHQPHNRKYDDNNEADLERFNDLSAIHVAMGAQIDEVREQLNEVFAFIRQMRTTLHELDPALTGLQRDLFSSRLVPFMNSRQKLFGVVATASKATNKDVIPTLEGEAVIMDKMMLDAISDPLTHILRNAVDHGIESKAERVKQGKSSAGSIKIAASRRAKHIVIEIKDDGRGIDIDTIKRKAIQMNLINQSDQLTRQEIMMLITRSGFSTAEKVTHVSGRGVGMDIVATAVEDLGGRLTIESEIGCGTCFRIELPFTIGSNKAMIVSSGSQWFAIQSYSMCQVLLVDRKALAAQRLANGRATVVYEDRTFEVVHLADLIAMPDSRGEESRSEEVTLLLCEQGDDRIAIEVAKVDSMPEIHIRKLEGMLANVRGIVGVTEMKDGSPVFVLDVIEMARLNLKQGEKGYQIRQNRVRAMKVEKKPTVLVVDDSRPYRAQLERIFQGFGYNVITAVDGQNALHKLNSSVTPDLMLVDVEMPNMNGFEFTESIRRMPNYDDTPIIMITTRTGLEEKAMRAGVTKYLLKPCDAASLDQAVNEINALKTSKGAKA